MRVAPRVAPRPVPPEVEVWRADLDLPRAALDALWATLAPDERARADRFRDDVDRRRFVAARGILRSIVGGHLGVPPREIVYAYSPHGKPALAPPAAALRFNVSHSAHLAVYALALGREVGVDVERVRPIDDAPALAAHFFSAAEVAALGRLDGGEREAAFFACWTRKEAYVKARGEGLSLALDAFTVSVRPGETTTLVQDGGAPGADGRRWTVVPLAPGDGFAGALAVEGPAPRLRHRDWPGDCPGDYPGGGTRAVTAPARSTG